METEQLQALAQPDAALDAWVIQQRRALHKRPELSGQEKETQAFLLARLAELGIEGEAPCAASHAVTGLIRGGKPGATLALRADMDALPVEEPESCPFHSETPGVMHACGHDAHMAIQLGVARLLLRHRDALPGTVRLLFEPAEETTGGAAEMIAAGCLENPHVEAVLALHVSPKQLCGHLSTRPGAVSGASTDVLLTVRGRAGHGAYPERSVDAIVIAAQVISALQTLVSRETSPLDSAVLSLGTIRGGKAANVICEEVVVRGTLRTLNVETCARMRRRIAEVTEGVARAMGGEAVAVLTADYGPVVNDRLLTVVAMEVAGKVLGDDHIHIEEFPSLGVDSFNFFVQDRPGVYWDMGCGLGAPLHAHDFIVDEACLPLAVRTQACMAWALLERLNCSR